MEFRTVKEFCKHAAPATKCPATFKDCNKDNCPLVRDSDECGEHCSLVNRLSEKCDELQDDICKIHLNARQLKKDLQQCINEYTQTVKDAAFDFEKALIKELDVDLDI